MWAYAQVGVHLDHWTGDQWNEGAHIPASALRPGDLRLLRDQHQRPSTIHHVGMYVGNGQMVEAPYTGANVRYSYAFRPDSSARCGPTTADGPDNVVRGERAASTRGRRLRRPQHRARDLLRLRRQRARRARPRHATTSCRSASPRGPVGAHRRRPGGPAITGRELPQVDPTGTALVLPGDPTAKGLVVLEPAAAAGRARQRRRGVSPAARPVRRGRHAAGSARARRRALRRLRRLRVGGGDGQAPHEAVARRGRASSRRTTSSSARATGRRSASRRSGCRCSSSPRAADRASASPRSTTSTRCESASREAHQHDPKALVEQAVVGREIECGVLAGRRTAPRRRCPAEIRVTGGQPSTTSRRSTSRTRPSSTSRPSFDDELVERIRVCAVQAFEAFDCEGLARVDFFVMRRRPRPHQRGQHDAGLHPELDVPAHVGGSGVGLPGARRPPAQRRAAHAALGCVERSTAAMRNWWLRWRRRVDQERALRVVVRRDASARR